MTRPVPGFPVEVFTIFWVLKKEDIEDPEDKANQMKEVLEEFPHFKDSSAHERQVMQRLIGILLKSGVKDIGRVAKLSNQIMRAIKA